MEIERKYLIARALMPSDCLSHPFRRIEQAYLCTDPVVRIRREDDTFYLTYKSFGTLSREEYNLPLNAEAYRRLLSKADGTVLTKKRYLIPLPQPGKADGQSLTIELDVFEGAYEGLLLAEVEFSSEEEALSFVPPSWFGREVTFTGEYQNSVLAMKGAACLEEKPDEPR